VDVRIVRHRQAPGVQYRGDADAGAEMAGVVGLQPTRAAVRQFSMALITLSWSRLTRPQHRFGREHARQLARLVDEHEMSCRLRPVECHLEEEPQHRHRGVDGWWLNAGRAQMQLEAAQILGRRRVRGSTQKGRQLLDSADVVTLRIGCEPAQAHVFEHALAQRADGLLAHWGSCLEVGVLQPLDPQDGAPARHLRSINLVAVRSAYPGRLLPR
jgi:hypothetical protein